MAHLFALLGNIPLCEFIYSRFGRHVFYGCRVLLLFCFWCIYIDSFIIHSVLTFVYMGTYFYIYIKSALFHMCSAAHVQYYSIYTQEKCRTYSIIRNNAKLFSKIIRPIYILLVMYRKLLFSNFSQFNYPNGIFYDI